MGPLAAQQKPKLWQLNYFTDKAELEALGPKRPEVVLAAVVEWGRTGVGQGTLTKKQERRALEKEVCNI